MATGIYRAGLQTILNLSDLPFVSIDVEEYITQLREYRSWKTGKLILHTRRVKSPIVFPIRAKAYILNDNTIALIRLDDPDLLLHSQTKDKS